MYLFLIDHLLEELQTHLLQCGAQYLLPTQPNHLKDANVQGIFTEFEGDLPDFEYFQREIQHLKVKCEAIKVKSDRITETLLMTNSDVYPNVTICIHVLLAMPLFDGITRNMV